jgi:4'-phosphopantetheinyl transferase
MISAVQFEPAPGTVVSPPPLASGEIHLWSARLEASPGRLERLSAVLSSRERARAGRYRFERHRRRYQVTWGLTRSLLGCYTATDPSALSFEFGAKGKPELVTPTALQFNISHSGERVVLAITSSWPLGVDIEELRPLEDAAGIARRFFSAEEVRAFEALDEAHQLEGFFNCWTRKEALIKAVGEGVFVSLDRFDVSLAPGEPARLVSLDGQPATNEPWHLVHLQPEAGMIGALATPAQPSSVRAWDLDLARQSIAPPEA